MIENIFPVLKPDKVKSYLRIITKNVSRKDGFIISHKDAKTQRMT